MLIYYVFKLQVFDKTQNKEAKQIFRSNIINCKNATVEVVQNVYFK